MRHAGDWRVWGMASLLLCSAAAAPAAQSAPRPDRSRPGALTASLRASRAFLNATDLRRARATLENALEKTPESPDARHMPGTAQIHFAEARRLSAPPAQGPEDR